MVFVLLYLILYRGEHPYGTSYERENNILNDKIMYNKILDDQPECVDLLFQMLNINPKLRPKVNDLVYHPFFWDDNKKLSFLCDFSDYVENLPTDSNLIIV